MKFRIKDTALTVVVIVILMQWPAQALLGRQATKTILGQSTKIKFGKLKNEFDARVDTGADFTAIGIEDEFSIDGMGKKLSLEKLSSADVKKIACEHKGRKAHFKVAGGHMVAAKILGRFDYMDRTDRLIVQFGCQIRNTDGHWKTIESAVTLANRTGKEFPILLGYNTIKEGGDVPFVVETRCGLTGKNVACLF